MRRLWIILTLFFGISQIQSANLEVAQSARYAGDYGMSITLSGEPACFVEDGSPISEARYRARFYLRLKSVTFPNGESITLFSATNASGITQCSISLIRLNGIYRIRTATRLETGAVVETAELDSPVIGSGWHCIEIDWQAALTDGFVITWFDGILQPGLTALANLSARIDQVRLGVPDGNLAGATGSMDLDLFESRRESYIGLSCYSPQDILGFRYIWRPDYSVLDLVQHLNAQCP